MKSPVLYEISCVRVICHLQTYTHLTLVDATARIVRGDSSFRTNALPRAQGVDALEGERAIGQAGFALVRVDAGLLVLR